MKKILTIATFVAGLLSAVLLRAQEVKPSKESAPAGGTAGPVAEPWTETLTNWSLVPHGDAEDAAKPHAGNLRLDRDFKRVGEGSLAFDILRPELRSFCYTEVRLTFPQPLDSRPFGAINLSYHIPAGMKITRFYVKLCTPDWKNAAGLPEALKPVTGAWQDLSIPFSQLAADHPGWDWSNVGALLVLFFWDEGPRQAGTVHLDGISLKPADRQAASRKANPAILFLDYYAPDKDIDATHRKNLEAKGYTVVWDLLQSQTWEKLSKFNVVVLGLNPEADVNKPGEWTGEFAGKRKLLERYVAEGGGLLVTGTPGSKLGGVGINLLLEPMGLSVVNEQVTDPKGIVTQQDMFPSFPYAYTDAVTKDAVTEGVAGLWYCTGLQFTGAGGGSFTAALKPGPDWNVLVKGSPTAGTHSFKGAFGIDEAPGALKSSPPLCAVRPSGKGRVAALPMNPTHIWLSGYHAWWQGLVMSKGAEGKPSGVEQLLFNLYGWLAQPSLASGSPGGYTGKPPEPITGAKYVTSGDQGGILDWNSLKPPAPSKYQYVGLIGVHSAFSDGKGTVAEWVAGAKAAGYDWIAFTEFHPKMTPEKWEQLKAECKQSSDDKFCALPGMQFVDQAGDFSLVLAPIPWPDPKLENDRMDLPHTIGYAYNFPAQVQYRMHEGLLPWYRNQFHFAGAFTYRNGKLVDDAEKEFHELSARTFNVWPVAVHETFDPKDLAAERKAGYQTWYTFGPLGNMHQDFCFPGYNYFFSHDLVYASSGPRIDRFAVQCNGTSYFDIPPESPNFALDTQGGDRWRAVIDASASAGLERVALLDADQPLRIFRPGGASSLHQEVNGHHDRQYALGLEVVDRQGGRAIAAAASSSAGRHWFGNCSDNVNIMEGGTYGPTDSPPLGYECYFPRVGYWLWPDLAIQDRGPLNLPHDERLRFGSADCTVVDNLYTVTHDARVGGGTVGGGRMLRPLVPIKDFEARVRLTRFTPGVNTPQYVIIEPEVKLKRDVVATAGGSPNFRLFYMLHGEPMAKGDFAFATFTTEDGRTLVKETPAENKWPVVSDQGVLPVGGYVGVFPNYTGDGAVFALEPGIRFAVEGNAKTRRIQIGKDVAPGTTVPAGTVLATRALFMEGKWRQLSGNVDIENTRRLLGLNGPPGYTVTPSVGKVTDTKFTCTLKTDHGAFRAKFSQAPLPVDLPILVSGLEPRTDAGVWITGTERVRHFGLFEGNGYTTLRLDKGPVEAFIGNPLTCDSPDLWVTLIEADGKHLLAELHNPTDKPIKARVRKNTGFDLGPPLDRKVTIPGGQSVKVEVSNVDSAEKVFGRDSVRIA